MDSGGLFFLIAVLVTVFLILLVIADYRWNFLPHSHFATGLEMRRAQQSQLSTGVSIEMATFAGLRGTDRQQTVDRNLELLRVGGRVVHFADSPV